MTPSRRAASATVTSCGLVIEVMESSLACSGLSLMKGQRRSGREDGGGVVAALGPGPQPAFGVKGFGGADLAEQLVRAALLQ